MARIRHLVFGMIVVLSISACSSPYKGLGDFVTSADYSGASAGPTPSRSPGSLAYAPKNGFQLRWPVNYVRMNRGFRPRGPKHDGVDLGGSRGSPILAAHEGVVVYAGRDFRGYGKMVLIEYNQHWATLYGHLHRIFVREGQTVREGDVIAGMGSTGRSSGVHLHFELIRNRLPVDPIPYLPVNRSLASTGNH